MRVGSLVKRYAPQGKHTEYGIVLNSLYGRTFSEVLVAWMGNTSRKKMYIQWITPRLLRVIDS